MRNPVEFSDLKMALVALGIMRRMTGDPCHLIRFGAVRLVWRIVREDFGGGEVEWEPGEDDEWCQSEVTGNHTKEASTNW
jgi:hypothetical protein